MSATDSVGNGNGMAGLSAVCSILPWHCTLREGAHNQVASCSFDDGT